MEKPLKDTFGLYISNSALTAVELAYDKKGLKVVNFARIELEPGIVEDDCIVVDRDAFKNAVSRLLQEGYSGPFETRNVVISIPEEKTFSHQLSVPRELAENNDYIMSLASDYIPVELNDAVIDFKTMQLGETKDVTFNFVAIQKNIVESIIETLAEVGLKVVFVDVDKNSVIRAINNRFQKPETDYLVIGVGNEKTSFSINSLLGKSYTLNSEIGGSEIIEKLKENLGFNTSAEISNILNELVKDTEVREKEQYKKIKNALKELYSRLLNRISELAKVAEAQDSIKIGTIYLVGSYSRTPGLVEALQSAFAEVKFTTDFEYIQLNENTELHFAEAIGLALKAVLPYESGSDKEINLLPYNKKEELFNGMLTPHITKSLFAICSVLAFLMVFAGVSTTKAYLNFSTSDREVDISLDKSQNPYLHQIAQSSQQRTQMESQISSILKDAMPMFKLMQKLDSFNSDGIDLISVSFKLSAKSNDIRIRAKTTSRSDTESFISRLQKDKDFSKVLSPLSNLSGKGEKFINIDLVADSEKIISGYAAAQNESNNALQPSDPKSKPKMPTIQSDESKIGSEASDTAIETDTSGNATDTEEGSADNMADASNTGTETSALGANQP